MQNVIMRSVVINQSQIQWETPRAYLIKIPRSKYRVWIAIRHTQWTRNGKQLRIIIRDDFEYVIFKDNKVQKDKMTVSAECLLEYFGYEFDSEEDDIIEDLKDDE